VGSGQKVVVPEPEDDWTHSEMTIHSLKIWAMD
jgi:hypothetical protein